MEGVVVCCFGFFFQRPSNRVPAPRVCISAEIHGNPGRHDYSNHQRQFPNQEEDGFWSCKIPMNQCPLRNISIGLCADHVPTSKSTNAMA